MGQQEYFEMQYRSAFRELPLDREPTCEHFRQAIVKTPVDSRKRLQLTISYGALARFLGMDCELNRFKGSYSGPEKRNLPEDQKLIEFREELLDRTIGLRKAFELIALYGLRPHEIFKLDFSDFHQDGYPLKVLEDTKTGYRVAFPLPAAWADKWDVGQNLALPRPRRSLKGLSNRQRGQLISSFFNYQKISHGWDITPTVMRDMYAIRGARLGADSGDVARWMGHSLTVHMNKYMVHIGQKDDQAIWSRLPRI
ncbi:MAG: hypothetical protein AAGG02_12545 [Cyanobacteria bacterium P01_H01_bin.15]